MQQQQHVQQHAYVAATTINNHPSLTATTFGCCNRIKLEGLLLFLLVGFCTKMCYKNNDNNNVVSQPVFIVYVAAPFDIMLFLLQNKARRVNNQLISMHLDVVIVVVIVVVMLLTLCAWRLCSGSSSIIVSVSAAGSAIAATTPT